MFFGLSQITEPDQIKPGMGGKEMNRFTTWLTTMKAYWFTNAPREQVAKRCFIAGMQEAVEILKERKGKEPSTDETETELENCLYDIECEIKELEEQK